MQFDYKKIEPDSDPSVLDLRDMPLFFEDIPEESYIPMTGPKRIDGLSQPHSGEDKKKRRKLPWIGLVLLLFLITGTAWAAVSHHPKPIVTRSTTGTSRTTTVTPAATTQVEPTYAYVNLVQALSIHSTPVFTSTNVIGSAGYGKAVTVLEQVDQQWTKVSFEGLTGYMSSYYLVDSPSKLAPNFSS